jgi:hypothetical protein
MIRLRFLDVVILLLFGSCTLLRDVSVNPHSFLKKKVNPESIYAMPSRGTVVSPFDMSIENPEKLIVFDFAKHRLYKFLECQLFNDTIFGTGIVCLLMRHDDRLEIYHTPGLNMKQQLYYFDSVQLSIPTHVFNPTCSFNRTNGKMEFSLSFTDRYGNRIAANLSSGITEPMDLIVPVGLMNRHHSDYIFFPLWYMRQLNFMRKGEGRVSIAINDTLYPVKNVPGLVNWKRVQFARWSFDPVFLIWNRNQKTITEGLGKGQWAGSPVSYTVHSNNGYAEIEKIRFNGGKHQGELEFLPALPEFFCLRDGAAIEGRFILNVDEKRGVIGGKYTVQRTADMVEVNVYPRKCWQPAPGRTWVRDFYLNIKLNELEGGKIQVNTHWGNP